jgi:hypothetical protein
LRLDGQDNGLRGVPGFRQRIELRAIGGIGLRFIAGLEIKDHHVRRRDMPLNAETFENGGTERAGAHKKDRFSKTHLEILRLMRPL